MNVNNNDWDEFFSDSKDTTNSLNKSIAINSPKPSEPVAVDSLNNKNVEDEDDIADFSYTNQSPKIIGEVNSPIFLDLLKKVKYQYLNLPSLKYKDVYEELSDLTVKACATPTLQVINQELQKSQAAKDRLTELDIQLTQCVMLKDRAVSILREAWNKISEEKSSDKRKGEGQLILANFEMDLAQTESLHKACKYVMMNLISLQDTLSRRITNIQLQIKLMDIGRSALPDFDFSKKSMDIQIDTPYNSSDNIVNNHITNQDGTILAKEENF